MVRIAGVTIPDNKKIEISLSYVYGIGRPVARKILARTKISDTKRAKDLSADEVAKLRDVIEKEYTVEGALRREIMQNIKRLRDIGSYRGTRHLRGLPARGQRTKTNSRTRRGNVRKTMGSGKRKLDKK
ncbi:MAG: 30S ribosomal protein S13 [Patescibacteria group bacterium]|mgnify:CR=1 FL=1